MAVYGCQVHSMVAEFTFWGIGQDIVIALSIRNQIVFWGYFHQILFNSDLQIFFMVAPGLALKAIVKRDGWTI